MSFFLIDDGNNSNASGADAHDLLNDSTNAFVGGNLDRINADTNDNDSLDKDSDGSFCSTDSINVGDDGE